MENFEILQKAITETKYFSQENTYRYRPIMRFFIINMNKQKTGYLKKMFMMN